MNFTMFGSFTVSYVVSHTPLNCRFFNYRGQSLEEASDFAEFAIELCLTANEMKLVLEKHGMTSPRIPSWFSTTQSSNGSHGTTEIWRGPIEDIEVARAIVEDFYEGCTWRYGRVKEDAHDPNGCK